ncbi:hypothetical protein [Clostridium beijerinckii]|uniref:hypothetical protein n=1 Tax=Clostridium beijerinckii TaxID=1520 RepID=UPI0015709CDE|nr:hypothetical protein [Clostridium beijerinckii]NRU52519.1 hypothetical protein [Clostridium beijerinckii]NYC69398.1 hypothetical protein [Clostridium beijerinckii]NYC91720.1 hypothetical protein [Clostridium beijerinckii]
MKTVMSISQYKKYSNSQITLIDIKLQNIGLNKNKSMSYLINHRKYIYALAILFIGYLSSEMYLNYNLDCINAYNYGLDSCVDLFKLNNTTISNV